MEEVGFGVPVTTHHTIINWANLRPFRVVLAEMTPGKSSHSFVQMRDTSGRPAIYIIYEWICNKLRADLAYDMSILELSSRTTPVASCAEVFAFATDEPPRRLWKGESWQKARAAPRRRPKAHEQADIGENESPQPDHHEEGEPRLEVAEAMLDLFPEFQEEADDDDSDVLNEEDFLAELARASLQDPVSLA